MRRLGWALLTCVAALGIAVPAAVEPSAWLLWNASASVPTGLYAVRPARSLAVADLVVVMPPEPLAAFLAERGYLPRGVPLVKRILALPGQTVCRENLRIIVDGITVGLVRDRDRRGRPLPAWQGCRVIADGEVFLMNRQTPDSLDGRYFGPLPSSAIVARAIPLWTDESGDGRFVWRASH